ncbi:hypothetical protein Nepgr_006292 [Nepenthes gracilis]|uniref:Uncharacterized protein n=1 Tax=Nepenthes gracilis TaxID=150966 RepID=A0AAD3XH89_NEPGR|nr:hypothetical protein Nepgr_006292 [Nepenthes gracilis]
MVKLHKPSSLTEAFELARLHVQHLESMNKKVKAPYGSQVNSSSERIDQGSKTFNSPVAFGELPVLDAITGVTADLRRAHAIALWTSGYGLLE